MQGRKGSAVAVTLVRAVVPASVAGQK